MIDILTRDSFPFSPGSDVSRTIPVTWNIFLVMNPDITHWNVTYVSWIIVMMAFDFKWFPELFPSNCLCWKREEG